MGQTELFEAHVKTAPCVPKIKEEVPKWADGERRYNGILLPFKKNGYIESRT